MTESKSSQKIKTILKNEELNKETSNKDSWMEFSTPVSLFDDAESSPNDESIQAEDESIKTEDESGLYVCDMCEYNSDCKRKFSYHIATKHKAKAFVCEECDYSTINKHILDRHTAAMHSAVKPFACSLCDYQTSQKGRLKAHVSIKHDGAKPFACKLCDFSTAYKVSLKLHIKGKHQDVRPFQCELCSYSAKTKNHLVSHVAAKHSSTKPYACTLCEYSAAQKIHLDAHIASKHDGHKRFSCEECDYCTTKKNNLERHMLARHSNNEITCDKCEFTCCTKRGISKHKRSHDEKCKAKAEPKKKLLYCHICEFTTMEKDDLSDHLATHGKTEEYPTQKADPPPVSSQNSWENIDHEIFTPVTALEVNESGKVPERQVTCMDSLPPAPLMPNIPTYQPIHTIPQDYSKILNADESKSRDEMNGYLRNPWSEYATPMAFFDEFNFARDKDSASIGYSIPGSKDSGHTTSLKGNLMSYGMSQPGEKSLSSEQSSYFNIQKHIVDNERTHPATKQFVCSHFQCGYQTSHKGRLESHEAIKHQGIKPYVCKICSFTTAYKVSLTLHIQGKHQDMRPFQCQLCPYSAKTKNHLLNHVAAKHSSTKPFTCTLCEYSAAQKIHLDAHMASKHDGIKRFSCELCKYSTNKKTCLVKHLVSRHHKNPIKCKECDFQSNIVRRMTLHMKTHNKMKVIDAQNTSESQPPDVPVSS